VDHRWSCELAVRAHSRGGKNAPCGTSFDTHPPCFKARMVYHISRVLTKFGQMGESGYLTGSYSTLHLNVRGNA
jgi:hypothetical protein